MTGELELQNATLSELGQHIASGALTPVDCVRHSIEMIEQYNSKLHAFLSHDAEAALSEAKVAEAEIARHGPRSAVHGIPFGVKDLFKVRGLERTCGSQVFAREYCDSDAYVVGRLREAGAIFLGMTSLSEFAYGPTGINSVSATARNPWDLERSCGGSSSGSGCAVAARMVPAALGTDTGGSIRIPAAICGVAGLKPSFGLNSREGIQPLSVTFDHPGPIARTAWDCGLVLASMSGADQCDATTWDRPVFSMPSEPTAETLKGRKIGVLESFFGAQLTSEVGEVFDAALVEMKKLGCDLVTASPYQIDAAMEAWSTICLAEAYEVHSERVRDHREKLSPDVAARLLLGRDITLSDYLRAVRLRGAFLVEMANVMETFDFLVLPTSTIAAVSIHTGVFETRSGPINGAEVLGKLTRLANQTGQPAISIPCGLTSTGLPVGLQMIGRWYHDAELIQAAAALQRATDWHVRRPVALARH